MVHKGDATGMPAIMKPGLLQRNHLGMRCYFERGLGMHARSALLMILMMSIRMISAWHAARWCL